MLLVCISSRQSGGIRGLFLGDHTMTWCSSKFFLSDFLGHFFSKYILEKFSTENYTYRFDIVQNI